MLGIRIRIYKVKEVWNSKSYAEKKRANLHWRNLSERQWQEIKNRELINNVLGQEALTSTNSISQSSLRKRPFLLPHSSVITRRNPPSRFREQAELIFLPQINLLPIKQAYFFMHYVKHFCKYVTCKLFFTTIQ